MKLRTAIATIVGVALCPSVALCAEKAGAANDGSWSALIFYVFNFVVFLWIIIKYAGPPIRNFFTSRSSEIRGNMARADANLREAQKLADQAAERIAQLDAEKARIQSDLADETVFEVSRIYDLAQEAVARIKRDTELSAEGIREAARRRTRQALAEASVTLARDLIARNLQPADHQRLLDVFVSTLGKEV